MAHLLFLDWMWLKLLTDSPLLSSLSLKVDQIGKTRAPDVIEPTNSIRNIPDSNTCAKAESPVAFDYTAEEGVSDFSTLHFPNLDLPHLPQAETFL